MDEVIDDLISLESGFNDGGLDCMESNILMQSNVSIVYCQLLCGYVYVCVCVCQFLAACVYVCVSVRVCTHAHIPA